MTPEQERDHKLVDEMHNAVRSFCEMRNAEGKYTFALNQLDASYQAVKNAVGNDPSGDEAE